MDGKESSGILPQQVNRRIITDAELWVDAWGSTNLPEAEARLNRTLKTTRNRAGGAAAVMFASVSVGFLRGRWVSQVNAS